MFNPSVCSGCVMKEDLFIRQNRSKWDSYAEKLGVFSSMSAEELANCYQDVLTDLAYAQTQFPDSRIVFFLNGLAKDLHQRVYSPRYYSVKQFVNLFTYEIPNIVVKARKELLMSFVLFSAFVIAGVIFSIRDEEFVVSILGEDYVDMTLKNIAVGKPTDVYSGGGMAESFLRIMDNNVKVSFKMYASGILPIIGPLYFIKSNGLMLGAFQTLFFLHDAGLQSMTAIWIHGAFEISSLIIAAGAAFAMGKGWVFPGTYSRLESLKQSGLDSVKILASTVPLFVVAAFFEGFVTRQVQYPLAVKLFLIFGSFSFIIFYYVVLPYKLYRKQKSMQK